VTGTGPGRLLREREDPRQASFLELFFDLAIIFALTQLSQRLLRDLAWLNAAQTLVLLAAVWWIWIATAWSTDWFNPAEPLIQRLVLGVMFAGLLMAAAIPGAFGRHGVVFAGAYAGIHLGRALVLLPALRGHPLQRRTMRVAVWFGISAVPWLVGAFLPESPRLVLWVAALALDYGSAWIGWPAPRLGRASERDLRVVGEHLSERYRQVFIIALGELVLVSGIMYSGSGFDLLRTLAFGLAFGNAALLWWIYFVPAGMRLGAAIEESPHPTRSALFAAYTHAVMVAGIVVTAVGDEVLITRPLGAARASWALLILGGSALFLVGRLLFSLTVYRHRSWRRLIGLIVIVAMTPGVCRLPPLWVGICTNLVLLGVTLAGSSRDPSPSSPRRGPDEGSVGYA
jgi:low temperature requirement protein LtrA